MHISEQVSIYGHSLGSVLSYDILCHQDTLSSPSPMDLVYQQPKDHTNSAANNENASLCSSLSNSGSRNVHEMVPPSGIEESTPLAPSAAKEEKEPAEHSSVDPSPSSPDNYSMMLLEPDQPRKQGNGELSDTADMLAQEGDAPFEAKRINCTVLDSNSEHMGTKESECEKPIDREQEIDALGKEVKSLTIRGICDNIHSFQESICHFYASRVLTFLFSD